MSSEQTFGGEWTKAKLDSLAKYLRAYTKIFTRNPRAKFFTTTYVDAFAGGGYIREETSEASLQDLFPDLTEEDTQGFIKGSAVRALEVEPGFDEYLFIEQSQERCEELEKLKAAHPRKVIEIKNANANDYLGEWCKKTDWRKKRAVVFLDPYGMQVEWALLEKIARTHAIDLWLLFPLGIGVMRLLTKRKPPPPEWARCITTIFGTEGWKEEFYSTTPTLFGSETEEREADYKAVGDFFLNRLKTIFTKVAEKPLVLRNSKNTPLYLFCFAAGNPKGAPKAVKIAQDIIGK